MPPLIPRKGRRRSPISFPQRPLGRRGKQTALRASGNGASCRRLLLSPLHGSGPMRSTRCEARQRGGPETTQEVTYEELARARGRGSHPIRGAQGLRGLGPELELRGRGGPPGSGGHGRGRHRLHRRHRGQPRGGRLQRGEPHPRAVRAAGSHLAGGLHPRGRRPGPLRRHRHDRSGKASLHGLGSLQRPCVLVLWEMLSSGSKASFPSAAAQTSDEGLHVEAPCFQCVPSAGS